MILAFVPIVVLAGMMIFLLSPYGQSLINVGTPLPQVTIEKVEFHDNQILAFIRNTGPLDIVVSQADVNDRIQSAAIEPSSKIPRLGEAHVMIPFPWIPGNSVRNWHNHFRWNQVQKKCGSSRYGTES